VQLQCERAVLLHVVHVGPHCSGHAHACSLSPLYSVICTRILEFAYGPSSLTAVPSERRSTYLYVAVQLICKGV